MTKKQFDDFKNLVVGYIETFNRPANDMGKLDDEKYEKVMQFCEKASLAFAGLQGQCAYLDLSEKTGTLFIGFEVSAPVRFKPARLAEFEYAFSEPDSVTYECFYNKHIITCRFDHLWSLDSLEVV